ncbi:MAG: ATP-binding protein [Cyclonatronaceae bacterium]
MSSKEQLIQTNQALLLTYIQDKNLDSLLTLLHPEISIFGTAIHEKEDGFDRVRIYYENSLARLPDEMSVIQLWKRFTDLGEFGLIEQEYELHFKMAGIEGTIPSIRQSTLWKFYQKDANDPGNWLIHHDHTSLPDQSGEDETLPLNYLLERNRELEKLVAQRTSQLEKMLKEAEVKSAIDRFRAEIATMRTSSDLERITPLVWQELNSLGISFIRCGVFIFDENLERVRMHLSTPQGKALATSDFSYHDMDIIQKVISDWREKMIYRETWSPDDIMNWYRFLARQGLIDSIEAYMDHQEIPDNLHLHFVPFRQGVIYAGCKRALDQEKLAAIQSLADAFSVAYSRYEDFYQLDIKNRELAHALNELKAAQDQLVQQEKLASLGQLTAGIAHEIKNPLNFVNNFSELSIELLEEAKEELVSLEQLVTIDGAKKAAASSDQGDDKIREGCAIISELLGDIDINIHKIHEHGSRADGIVKSMLMHSRGSNGNVQPTDLNELVREYTNLSFHGMRAGKDPIAVDIELDMYEGMGEIPLIAEDFSRVILNLCTNAFDAMKHKSAAITGRTKVASEAGAGNGMPEDYNPRLTVRTRKSSGRVTIEIEDNGPGIPDDIRDKIMQPFFTTKKGTQGTGLGLSITNDIVMAHGGTIQVESDLTKGSVFRVSLPAAMKAGITKP